MAGTKIGGQRAAQTNKEKYGEDFYRRIGKTGGANSHTGGFASPLLCDCEYKEELHKKASCAGYKGGKLSKRTPSWEMETAFQGGEV